jgi:hypothetical protein
VTILPSSRFSHSAEEQQRPNSLGQVQGWLWTSNQPDPTHSLTVHLTNRRLDGLRAFKYLSVHLVVRAMSRPRFVGQVAVRACWIVIELACVVAPRLGIRNSARFRARASAKGSIKISLRAGVIHGAQMCGCLFANVLLRHVV